MSSECKHCGCSASMARWATVIIDPETQEPIEASEDTLEELAALNIDVERVWMAPGPLNEAGLE